MASGSYPALRPSLGVRLVFDVATVDEFISQEAANIGKGGIFIPTPSPLPRGTPIQFEMTLGRGGPFLSGTAQVAWVRADISSEKALQPGMGLRFVELAGRGRAVLNQIIERSREIGGAPEGGGPRIEVTPLSVMSGADRAPLSAAPVDIAPRVSVEGSRAPVGRRSWRELLRTPTGRGALFLASLTLGGGVALLVYQGFVGGGTVGRRSALAGDRVASRLPASDVWPLVSQRVESLPPGALLLLDGKDTGLMTPASIPDLDPQVEIEITLDLAGKKLQRTRLRPDPRRPLVVALEQAAARRVRVTSAPDGAQVFFNGRAVGRAPLDLSSLGLDLDRPHYWIGLELEGHRRLDRRVVPGELRWTRAGEDEVAIIAGQLEPLPGAHHRDSGR